MAGDPNAPLRTDAELTDATVVPAKDRVVVDDNGRHRRIFAGRPVAARLAALPDAPSTAKRVAAPARDKAERSPERTK